MVVVNMVYLKLPEGMICQKDYVGRILPTPRRASPDDLRRSAENFGAVLYSRMLAPAVPQRQKTRWAVLFAAHRNQ